MKNEGTEKKANERATIDENVPCKTTNPADRYTTRFSKVCMSILNLVYFEVSVYYYIVVPS